VVKDKKWKTLKEKLKAITGKTTPSTFDELLYTRPGRTVVMPSQSCGR
jgi:hypothetical protein